MSERNENSVTHAYLQKALFVLYLSVAGSFIAIVSFHAQHPHEGAVDSEMFKEVNKSINRRMENYEKKLIHLQSNIQKMDRRLVQILVKMEIE